MTQTAFQVDAFQNDAFQIVAQAAAAAVDSGLYDADFGKRRKKRLAEQRNHDEDVKRWLAGLDDRVKPPEIVARRVTLPEDITPIPVFELQPEPQVLEVLEPPAPTVVEISPPPLVHDVAPSRPRRVRKPPVDVVLVSDDRAARIHLAASAYRASRVSAAVKAYQKSKKRRHA